LIIWGNIKLVPLEHKFLPYLVRWTNDLPASRLCSEKRPTNIVAQEARLASSQDKVFIAKMGTEVFGMCRLRFLSGPARVVEIETFAEDKFQNGEKKILLGATRYCFWEAGVNKICTQIMSSNTGLIKMYDEVGFKLEVRNRQHLFDNKQFHHIVDLALLFKEYDGPKD
jgi:RimJ/RimL family protein N-acetyltransferase